MMAGDAELHGDNPLSVPPPNESGRGAIASADDSVLMKSISAQDPSALGALYDRHAGIVYAVCLRILRSREDADEVLGDVFFEIWHRSDRFDAHRANVRSYLLMLARSRSIDRVRARGGIAAHTTFLSDNELPRVSADIAPGHSIEMTELQTRVANALLELEPDQRLAIESSFFDGLSHDQIATNMKRPLGTVKSYIRRGLARLRGQLPELKD